MPQRSGRIGDAWARGRAPDDRQHRRAAAELDALRTWLAAAREGWGRLVLCAGEPGIAKTRLAQESKAHADRFFAERLGPALAKVLGPEPVGAPEVVGIDLVRAYTRERVA